jgi:hypothetical protein
MMLETKSSSAPTISNNETVILKICIIIQTTLGY